MPETRNLTTSQAKLRQTQPEGHAVKPRPHVSKRHPVILSYTHTEGTEHTCPHKNLDTDVHRKTHINIPQAHQPKNRQTEHSVIHSKAYRSFKTRHEELIHTTTWINLENTCEAQEMRQKTRHSGCFHLNATSRTASLPRQNAGQGSSGAAGRGGGGLWKTGMEGFLLGW